MDLDVLVSISLAMFILTSCMYCKVIQAMVIRTLISDNATIVIERTGSLPGLYLLFYLLFLLDETSKKRKT